jgi:hypothetical protein
MICNYSNTSLNAQNALKEKSVFSKSAFSRAITAWRVVQICYFVPVVIHANGLIRVQAYGKAMNYVKNKPGFHWPFIKQ